MAAPRTVVTATSKISLSVDKDRATGGFQLSIGDDRTGYRIHGPKYCGQSSSLIEHSLTQRDAEEIYSYIKPLLAETPPPSDPSLSQGGVA